MNKIRNVFKPTQNDFSVTKQPPRNQRLFVHKYEGDIYMSGLGFTFKVDPETLYITDQAKQSFSSDYDKPFNHYYQCIEVNGKYYGLMKQNLVEFRGFDLTTIAQIPTESSEKYKIFAQSGEIYVLDDQGLAYQLKNKQFVRVNLQFTLGDCYATSFQNHCVILNNTSKQIILTKNNISHSIPMDSYMTLDVLTPFYCSGHTDHTNILMDFTQYWASGDLKQIKQFSTGRRVKDIEWNRAYQALRLVHTYWVLNNESLSAYMDLDVEAFVNRIQALLNSSPRAQLSQLQQQTQFYQQNAQNQPSRSVSAKSNQSPVQNAQPLNQNDLVKEPLTALTVLKNQQNFNLFQKDEDINIPLQREIPEDNQYQMIVKQQEQINSMKTRIDALEQSNQFYQRLFGKVVEQIGVRGWDDVMKEIAKEAMK
ncbi:Conserved_hypothetical protein [Hexamita inflata]|uniref:Uncharacterized protein n=1 Tax=Hexamita inflata TaxID=28002 RepID=A0AA86U5H9_9EUKA|nr:Conserved hypothetical protein [Hexamita inflata]CAI9931138.1 Conserved hypothetical protein [Hexamita inflata]